MLLKNSVLFIFFEIMNKAIPFFLLPLMTRYLTPADYGMVASFTALVSFVGIFLGLSGHGAVDVNYHRLGQKKIGIYVGNVALTLFLTTIMVVLTVLCLGSFLEELLELSLEWQILAVLVSLGQFLTLINMSLWVIEKKPLAYGIYSVLQTFMITSFTLLFVLYFLWGWEGQVVANLIGTVVFANVSLVILSRRGYLKFKFNLDYIKDFLGFGLPMVPHQLGGWIRSQGDKIIIISLLGSEVTGLFSVGYQLSMIMSVIAGAGNKVLYPILYEFLQKNLQLEEKNKIVRYSYLLFVGIVILAMLLLVVLEFSYTWLIGENFQGALMLTRLVVLSFVFEGFYYVVVNYIFFYKKTAQLAKITSSVSILHVALSYTMISLFGVIGAGYALIISGMIEFVFVWMLSSRVCPMPWFSFWKNDAQYR